MGDLIDRQDAINVLCDNCDHVQAVCSHYPCKQYTKIEQLPSAQPTQPNTPNTLKALDCISRKDAIDALWGEREKLDSYMDLCLKKGLFALRSGTKAERNRIEEDIEIITRLPSAQPEIIHCCDCKHRGEKPIADGRYWCEIHDTFMYYCSDAERRTDEWMGNS